jgi:hypothetical protein
MIGIESKCELIQPSHSRIQSVRRITGPPLRRLSCHRIRFQIPENPLLPLLQPALSSNRPNPQCRRVNLFRRLYPLR